MGKLTLLSYEAYNVAPKQPPVRFLPGLTVCSLNPLTVSHRLWPPGSLISRAAGRCNWVWRNNARGPTGRTVGLYTAWSLDHHIVSCCCCSDTRRLQRLLSHSTELMDYRPTYGMADECYSLYGSPEGIRWVAQLIYLSRQGMKSGIWSCLFWASVPVWQQQPASIPPRQPQYGSSERDSWFYKSRVSLEIKVIKATILEQPICNVPQNLAENWS